MPSSITVSSISAITAAAGLSSLSNWSQLTVAQINNLITAVNQQIVADGAEIATLTTTISNYERQIDVDPNLQQLFNDADFIYNSTLTEYIRVSTLVQANQSTFNYDVKLLSSYSTTAAGYLSSLRAAQREYSTLMSSISYTLPLIQQETSTLQNYQSTFNSLSSFCNQYSPSYNLYNQSTIQLSGTIIPNTLSAISLVLPDYINLSTSFASTPTDTTISTNFATKSIELANLQTQSTTSQALLDNATISTTLLSTLMDGCDSKMAATNRQINQLISNINFYIQISTSYTSGSSEYWAQFTYWSTMEQQALSSITGYTNTRDTLIGQRNTLAGEIDGLKNSLRSKLSQLDSAAATFYTKKQDELINEVLEFQNASKECNAYVGMLTAEVMLQKLDLFTPIDTLSFYIQSTVNANDMTTKAALEAERGVLLTDQTALQTQADKMNPLDVKFNALDVLYENERLYKTSFIQKRSTLHALERQVIAYPSTRDSIKVYYEDTWALMNTAINSANTQIRTRRTRWGEISSILDTVKSALLVDPLNKYSSSFDPFIAYYPYTYNEIAPQDATQTTTVVSEYALLPAIDFTKPISAYSL